MVLLAKAPKDRDLIKPAFVMATHATKQERAFTIYAVRVQGCHL